MLLGFEPTLFYVQTILGRPTIVTPLTRWLIVYSFNLLTWYELTRMWLLLLSICLHLLQKASSILRLASKFQPSKENSYFIKQWVGWYKQMQILIRILNPLLNGATLLSPSAFCMGLIMIFYILIRMSHLLTSFMRIFSIYCFILIIATTKVGWEILADIYDNTAELLVKLQRAEADCSFVSHWQGDVYWKILTEYRKRKEYSRVAKTLRPIGIPLGIGNHTFFVANKSFKIQGMKILADRTINVLLIKP